MKTVTTVIRCSPFNSAIASEALRMSLGLVLGDNRVRVVFAEDGVYLLGDCSPETIEGPEVKRHIETLREFDCDLIAEQESLEARGMSETALEVKRMDRDEIARLLAESDRVAAF